MADLLEELNNDDFELFNTFRESKLIRSDKAIGSYTSQDVTDFVFLYFVSLKILRCEFDFAPKAIAYAKATMMHGGFAHTYRNCTDLHILLHQLFHGDVDDLKKPEASEIHLEDVTAKEQDITQWLRMLAHNQSNDDYDRRFLLKMERTLAIKTTAYKAIRRLAVDWDTIGDDEKRLAMTRLLMALRKRARRSELLPYLESLAKQDRLEIKKGVINPETGKEQSTFGDKILKGIGAIGSAYLGFKGGQALGRHLAKHESEEPIGDAVMETTAGCVATAVSALGAGDPEASIYASAKKKKKKTDRKPIIIRRPSVFEGDELYAGEHSAPDPDNGAPMHDLSGIYPDDFYTFPKHYSSGEVYDHESFSAICDVKGRPNRSVKVYRAVPYEPTKDERIANLMKQKAYILKHGTIPHGISTPLNKSQYYEMLSNELEQLQNSPDNEPSPLVTINQGDWVTPSRKYAMDHGRDNLNNKFKIVSKTVRACELYTDGNSIHEWGYHPKVR